MKKTNTGLFESHKWGNAGKLRVKNHEQNVKREFPQISKLNLSKT